MRIQEAQKYIDPVRIRVLNTGFSIYDPERTYILLLRMYCLGNSCEEREPAAASGRPLAGQEDRPLLRGLPHRGGHHPRPGRHAGGRHSAPSSLPCQK